MFCTKCGKQLQEGTKTCPHCNNVLNTSVPNPPSGTAGNTQPPVPPKRVNTGNTGNGGNNKKQKPKYWISITSLTLAIIMFLSTAGTAIYTLAQSEPAASGEIREAKIASQSTGETEYETEKIQPPAPDISVLESIKPNPNGANQARAEIAVVETAISTAEAEIALEYPNVTSETYGDYLSAVASSVRELYYDDQIQYYSINDTSIRIELNTGGYYIYVPNIEGLDAGSIPELSVATYQPYYTSGQYENVPGVRSYPDDGANLIAGSLDAYVFNTSGANDSDYNDTEVDPTACANFGKHNVILWHGHGTYDGQFGPLMALGIKRTADTDSKYHALLSSGTMLYTQSTYLIGADFINTYVPDGSLENTVIYIGVCSSGRTSELADAFLSKGAAAVYAPDASVLTTYNASMIRSICEGLSTQHTDGTYYNVQEALTHAQGINGEDDNGPNDAEIVLFTNNPSFSLDWYVDCIVAERDVVLTLDISGSMSGTPLNETKNAATKFVNTVLDENARIGIVTYDSYAEKLIDFSTRKRTLTNSIAGLDTRGMTNIDDALRTAENMLKTSKAKRKIIVLMSDGLPNEGRTGADLVNYAKTLKEQGIYIYTLGFFHELSSYERTEAKALMDAIATEGHHYEVTTAEDLVYFFGDMADTISGQKYIYIQIACPVDVMVTKNGETLSSSDIQDHSRTSFGTISLEEIDGDSENTKKILRLKDGAEYDIQIQGTGWGSMDYTVQYMDDNGDYSDKRSFMGIPVSYSTRVETVASATRPETILNVDEDGDGKYDKRYKAGANQYAQEYKSPIVIILVFMFISILWIVASIILLVFQTQKAKKLNAAMIS